MTHRLETSSAKLFINVSLVKVNGRTIEAIKTIVYREVKKPNINPVTSRLSRIPGHVRIDEVNLLNHDSSWSEQNNSGTNHTNYTTSKIPAVRANTFDAPEPR